MIEIPFHRPNVPNDIGEIIPDSLKKGWLTTGPQVKLFEEKLSEFLQSKYVIAVNSCTARSSPRYGCQNF